MDKGKNKYKKQANLLFMNDELSLMMNNRRD